MALKKYTSKRKSTSPEPKAKLFKRKRGDLQFVVQKHAASHLHYDFRLELDGVLKSWAIPKGPSLNPNEKHLAILVEDHPYSYRNFEGIIPSGYGAGTVMIWDRGTYSVEGASGKETEKVIREGLKKGAIRFTLNGNKLQGSFVLIKFKNDENNWLLIKVDDEFASKSNVLKKDRSVVSDKTMEELANGKKRKKPHVGNPY